MENVALTGHRLVGLSSQGAGVFNAGQLHVRDSALLHNQGADRGAVAGGTTGGAIYNACNGKSSIERSLLAFNRAARAPAIYNGGVSSFPCPTTGSDLELPTVTITNSGVFKHFPNVELDAGGPLLAAIVNRGLLRISWSTLYQDEYDAISSSGRTELGNNLIWSRDLSGPTNTSCSGSGYASLGGNWVYGDGCGTGPSDRTGSIPGLVGQLVDVGGFSPTLEMNPPTSGSTGGHPVDATVTGLPFCPPSDQRDYRRPTDGNGDGTASCDVGAVEVRSSPRF
jgi:hypothetical protein